MCAWKIASEVSYSLSHTKQKKSLCKISCLICLYYPNKTNCCCCWEREEDRLKKNVNKKLAYKLLRWAEKSRNDIMNQVLNKTQARSIWGTTFPFLLDVMYNTSLKKTDTNKHKRNVVVRVFVDEKGSYTLLQKLSYEARCSKSWRN